MQQKSQKTVGERSICAPQSEQFRNCETQFFRHLLFFDVGHICHIWDHAFVDLRAHGCLFDLVSLPVLEGVC